ncbi:MAG TPA: hypothetical protein VN259_07735 [Xanthomonadales bacterium]|nr:hypothetical protein [Xanthomonadales bacterium]
MTSIDRFQSLPIRLRRAVWIWLGLAPFVALFSGPGTETLGVLAHPAFWCGLLPAIALAPHWRQLLPLPVEVVGRKRRTSSRAQARRRGRGRQGERLAA